jgi:hypothetical protein
MSTIMLFGGIECVYAKKATYHSVYYDDHLARVIRDFLDDSRM